MHDDSKEPVAWLHQCRKKPELAKLTMKKHEPALAAKGYQPIPLYAAPQASEAVRNSVLEEAAQALEKRAAKSRNEYDRRKSPYFEGSADAYDVGAFVVRALKTQADKDGGDCAKGAGDVAMRDAARWRSFRNAVTQQDMGWLDRMDAALTAMGCDLDDEAPPNADQVDAAADAAMAALSAQPGAQRNG